MWTFPLNIGYVTSSAQANFHGALQTRLFKDPEKMITAIKEDSPDIVCLSYYVWNSNLNNRVFEIAKSVRPDTLTVGGGPRFTNINANKVGAGRFSAEQRHCDVYVLNQGERGFLEVLERFDACGRNRRSLLGAPVAGSILFPGGDASALVGQPLDPLKDLDDIPSPYLSGMLDEFFDGPYVPIIETNRSCPYRCTFCAWGIGTQKLSRFSDQRVLDEIQYISERCTKTTNFYIGDANFGILERDSHFAQKLRDCHKKYGFPGHVTAQWNKTRPDRVLATAKVLGEISEVGASMQSLNPTTLEAIKRKNLPLDSVASIVNELRASGTSMPLFTELILGLPEETKTTHIDANKRMIDLGAEIFNYNLHLLPGTEMDSDESRDSYFRKTGWRLHDNAYGVYDGRHVFEGQEVALETSTMDMDELRSFRFIHFLLQFMWGRKWYFDFLNLFRRHGIHPVDVILRVAEMARGHSGQVGDLYREFSVDHDLESFETFDELREYWSQDANFERLKSGDYGKLNYVFTFKILLGCYTEFNALLMDVARDLTERTQGIDGHAFLAQCEDLLRFADALQFTITEDRELVENKEVKFTYDILPWKKSNYQSELVKAEGRSAFVYRFFLPREQKQMLEKQLNQFQSDNINQVLRQMSVDSNPEQFFYDVEKVA